MAESRQSTTYVPSRFAAGPGRARTIVDGNRLATLVTADLDAVEVPLVCIDPPGADITTMIGHVAAAGPLAHLTNVRAVAIHRGVEGYISPSYYATKREHGRVVPTWDYETVHLRGLLHVSRDPADALAAVRLLTDLQEGVRAAPWSVDDAPAGYLQRQLRNIVALRLVVEHTAVSDKLSQNRSPDDVAGTIAGLRADGRADLADAVERTPPA